MSDDIVARLRQIPRAWPLVREAADEIELLRSTVTDCRIEIERLTAERDEARREICINATNEPYRQICGSGILLPQDEARERNWDCFKEDGK